MVDEENVMPQVDIQFALEIVRADVDSRAVWNADRECFEVDGVRVAYIGFQSGPVLVDVTGDCDEIIYFWRT